MRTAAPVSFTLDLSGRTGPDRVARALVEAIASGQVHDGDRLPSTRTLAATFGLARAAVVGAYEELTAAGFLVARPGGATYVEQGAAAAARAGAFGAGNGGASETEASRGGGASGVARIRLGTGRSSMTCGPGWPTPG
jgi:DNA-binding transcriptional MocR family regulator